MSINTHVPGLPAVFEGPGSFFGPALLRRRSAGMDPCAGRAFTFTIKTDQKTASAYARFVVPNPRRRGIMGEKYFSGEENGRT